MKLTQEQIKAIDKALWDIEIRFLDIRIEMTDHAATALEGMEGNFDANLRKYIADNKNELKKNYSQFRMNASVKSVKLLFWNMLSLRFLAILAIVYAVAYADYKYEGFENASTTLFVMLMMAVPSFWIYYGYISFTRERKLFSTAQRLLRAVSGSVYLLCIPLYFQIDKLGISDELKLLYSTFVISFLIMIVLTYRFLTKFYKSRYQVA
jgi:hypothetical protein